MNAFVVDWCEWTIECDEPGCKERVDAVGVTDRAVIDAALRHAIASGWLIEHDRFIRPRLDLCPQHRKDHK